MLSRIPRRPVFLCLALALALTVGLGTFGVGVAQEKDETAGPNEKITELLRQRLKVVTRLHEMLATRYGAGTVRLEEVLDAQTMMLDARLPFCKTKTDRVKVHEEIVAAMQKTLAIVEARTEAALVDRTDLLLVQARLLEMQIELEKEKAGE